jgi:hypothetical protein
MPPAVVFLELDIELPVLYHRADEEEDGAVGGESWDDELIAPGRMVYVGQGQAQFVRVDEEDPGLLYPKRKKKKKKKKKKKSQVPEPAPAPASPSPIDWSDWEEVCQFGPPLLPAAPWVPEDWEPEICPPSPREDWEPEICPPSPREDWMPELLN